MLKETSLDEQRSFARSHDNQNSFDLTKNHVDPTTLSGTGENRTGPYKQGLNAKTAKSATILVIEPSTAPQTKQFKQPKPTRVLNRRLRERKADALAAARFSWQQGWPLCYLITLTWPKLVAIGECNEGHILGKAEPERSNRFRKRLGRVAKELGFVAAWVWSLAYGRSEGVHMHMYLFWPSKHIERLKREVERLTGDTRKRDNFVQSKLLSQSGGWSIVRRWKDSGIEGSIRAAIYVASQIESHSGVLQPNGKAFGMSAAINKAAQRRDGFR